MIKRRPLQARVRQYVRSSKMSPTVATDSRLTIMMGLSLDVLGKVLA